MYSDGEVVLDSSNHTETDFRNVYSKKLDKPIDISLKYNPQTGELTIFDSDKTEKIYACDTVRNLSSCFNQFVIDELENSEIDVKQGHQINIELGNVDLENELEK